MNEGTNAIDFLKGYQAGEKAGIKEVVDFIGKEPFEHDYFSNDCFACKWEAKLKDWGVEPLIEVDDETRTTE